MPAMLRTEGLSMTKQRTFPAEQGGPKWLHSLTLSAAIVATLYLIFGG